MRIHLLLILLALWASLPAEDKPVILVLGDSLSAGFGMDTGQSWVTLLQNRLDAQGYGYRVVNASVSGDTTRTGLSRLPQALAQSRPRVVIVALGGNDGLRGLPLTELRDSLAAIVRTSREAGARVLLAGVRLPPNYGPAYTRRFEATYRELAKEYGLELVPHLLQEVAEYDALMQDDRLHPTAAAQARILDNVWPVLQKLLAGIDAPARTAGGSRCGQAAGRTTGENCDAGSTSTGAASP